MREKGLAPILAVFTIVVLGIIAYLGYSQLKPMNRSSNLTATLLPVSSVTSDIAANWKTYINPRNKFTFKYPPSLTATNYTDWMYEGVRLEYNLDASGTTALPDASQTQSKINTGSPKSAETLLNMVEVIDTSSTAEKYSNDIYYAEKTDAGLSVSYSPIKTTSISGRNVYYFEKTNSQVVKEMFVDLDKETILRINIYSNDSLVDQILSTFKFTQ